MIQKERRESIALDETNKRITSLKLQSHNHQRVNVFLDGEFAFGISKVLASNLYIGEEINAEQISQLLAEDEYEVGIQNSIRFIHYQPRTETEIQRKLEQQKLGEETILKVVSRLKEIGLIDDKKYAQSWVENHITNRPRSRRALAYELRQRGIDPQIIDEVTKPINDDEMAYRVALKQSRKLGKMGKEVFLQKMYRHLSQRGFNYEVSRSAISQVIKDIYDTDQLEKNEVFL